jgi:hypothetical protein
MRFTRDDTREFVSIALLILIVTGGFAVARLTSPSPDASDGQPVGQSQPQLRAGMSSTPTTVETPTLPEPTVATPSPAIGEPFSFSALEANAVTLVRTDGLPIITQEQAMQVVTDIGVPWGKGGTWEKGPVNVHALYGLATFGGRGSGGIWQGERNIPLPSGEILDHIELRPMWIIDYGNTTFAAGGCPECPEPPDYNHSVYAVDAETAKVWIVWGYVGD